MPTAFASAISRSWVGPTYCPPTSEITPPLSFSLRVRPPTTLLASSRQTDVPSAASRRAVVRPASPAPTTATWTFRRGLALASDTPGTASAAPAAAAPPMKVRRVIGGVMVGASHSRLRPAMDAQHVRVSVDAPLGRIELNRPEKRNALSPAVLAALVDAARDLDA